MAIIKALQKTINGVVTTFFPQTTTAAVLDFNGTTTTTQQQINAELRTKVEAAAEQYNHVTQAWYDAADANTSKSGSTWTAINPAAPSLKFGALYVIDDTTYESGLRNVIEEMFVEITEAEYDAKKEAGTLNPLVWYFVVYPESSTETTA